MEWMSHTALAGDEIYEKELEKIIVKDNNKYIKKLQLGKMTTGQLPSLGYIEYL